MDSHENTSTGKCVGVGQNTLAVLGNYRRTGAVVAPYIKGRSDGNGALMRVAPVAVRHWSDLTRARKIAGEQSRTTHCSALSEQICIAMMDILTGLISGNSWSGSTGEITSHEVAPENEVVFQGSWKHKVRDEISSSGYVVDTFEAALWAVESTTTFEDALIAAVNLGHDADTVGAVAGQLAGARYGIDAIPQRWLHCLIKVGLIQERFDRLWSGGG
jgi:ADP-ribosyl-[dinitrogen reductase] hydrolase